MAGAPALFFWVPWPFPCWSAVSCCPFKASRRSKVLSCSSSRPTFPAGAVEDCLIKAVPIFLCSLGVSIAFRLQIWNIGAEGQYAMGAIGATWAALTFSHLPGVSLLPIMFLAAGLLGAIWGFLPALFKVRLRANEIIVTLMLNYIGILLLDYLVYGPWKDPASFGFPMTKAFPPAAIVRSIGQTRLNWGILVCVAAGAAFWIFIKYTRLGFELRASGENPKAARYARIPYNGLVLFVMSISGALAGWAGLLEASANLNRLQPSIMAGYGYTAIVVAWLSPAQSPVDRHRVLFTGWAARRIGKHCNWTFRCRRHSGRSWKG